MRTDRYSGGPLVPTRNMLAGFHAAHVHTRYALSRRRFLKGAAGATVAGAAVASGLVKPLAAQAAGPGLGLAEPIPGTLDFFGVLSHVQAPPLTPIDTDPATIFNFQGTAGIAFISGTVDRTDRRSGETVNLPYSFNDMRFMKGVFRGRDGHARSATFAFV
jgi:hypothetical protein